MNNTMLLTTLTLLATLIIVALLGVAAFLHWKLYKAKKRSAAIMAEQEQLALKKRQEAINSLRIIAKSYLAEQVELAEAGIRISRLMDYLAVNESERMPFRVFDEIQKKLAHIPIKQHWNELEKFERRLHQKTILTVEKEFEDFAKSAAEQLAVYQLTQPVFYAV